MVTRTGNPAPVALFVYNRPVHAKMTVESLLGNELSQETDLIIFSDGPKNQQDAQAVGHVRDYINTIAGFKSVTVKEQQYNRGLSNSIIAGVTEVVNACGRIIVLEDDMIMSPHFLRFMNDALELYENEHKVVSVHGYTLPVKKRLPKMFFLPGADCWGWATWRRGWEIFQSDSGLLLAEIKRKGLERDFDFNGAYPYMKMLRNQCEGKIDSWAIRWRASAIIGGQLTLHSGRSLVKNIGLDGTGTHCGTDSSYDTELSDSPVTVERIPVETSAAVFHLYEEYLAFGASSSLIVRSTIRARRYLKKIFNHLGGQFRQFTA